jgi:hypothetical protein
MEQPIAPAKILKSLVQKKYPKVSSIPYSPEASTGLSSHPQKFPDSSPFLLHKSHQPPQSLRRGIVEILFPTLKDQ